MAGTARERSEPKNSRQRVRTWSGIRCRTKRAEVMSPSQPSFCTPGSPARNLSVTSLPKPGLAEGAPGHGQDLRLALRGGAVGGEAA